MSCGCSFNPCAQYAVGTQITATQSFFLNGLPYTPVTAFAFSHSPAGVIASLTTVLVTAGVYSANFTPTTAGAWIVRFADSATPPSTGSFVAEQMFYVNALLY